MPRSKRNITFVNFVNRKYGKELGVKTNGRMFNYWDDYAMWLYFKKYKKNDERYYEALEEDIKEYSDLQTGKEEDIDE